jgi:hypothetical protein
MVPALEYALPLGGANVVATPFTQSTAVLLPAIFSSNPVTYTLPPETAIAPAPEIVMLLGKIVAAPFNQYTAVSFVPFDAVPATYTSLPEIAIP